jgi:sugar/nucleoside kinase (ribokinase family)
MTGKTCDVVVVGEIYVDHVFSGFAAWPGPGEEVTTDAYVREVGGGAATTACGLARLGRSVKLLGLIGAADKTWIMARLGQFGLGSEGLRVAASGSTGVTVSVSTRQDRSFFTHVGVNAGLSDLLVSPAALNDLTSARHVHFALPLAPAVAARVLPVLAAAGCTTSLDVGYQPQWLSDPANTPTLAAIDHFLPNEKEAELWCGAVDEDTFFEQACARGLKSPMFKQGARGAATEISGQRLRARPPQVEAIDTTGAGDAFDAGFIDALLDGASPQERLRRACIVGALSTRVAGALDALPGREDIRIHS